MKKLIAIFGVLAFTAGMAFAQNNEATVTQVEDGNIAFIEQIGDNNLGDINQVGSVGLNEGEGHDAKIEQTGNNNEAFIDQDFLEHAATTLTHRAYVTQTGDWNEADILQTRNGLSNQADIVQIGNHNVAGVQQQDGAVFNARQEGNNNTIEGVTTDRAEQRTGNLLAGTYNEMQFDQEGNWNTIQARQYDTQSGISGSVKNMATINQYGDYNDAWMSQKSGNNTLTIDQTGDYNNAHINQQHQ